MADTLEIAAQYEQDRYVKERFFHNKTEPGVFVEVGAVDGKEMSNTWHFEKHMGWTGLCLEPHPVHWGALCANRSCTCLPVAAYDRRGTAVFSATSGYWQG